MTFDLANVAGFVGMVLILAAYGYQTMQAERTRPALQHGLNLIGALLLVASLLVLESIWALIALFGLWRALRSSRA